MPDDPMNCFYSFTEINKKSKSTEKDYFTISLHLGAVQFQKYFLQFIIGMDCMIRYFITVLTNEKY